MRIRRFTGTGVRETMEAIRAAVGPKAVILSTQKLPDGNIEIVTAVEHVRHAIPESAQQAAAAALALAQESAARETRAPGIASGVRSALRSALRPQLVRPPDEVDEAQDAAAPAADAALAAPPRSIEADAANLHEPPVVRAAAGIHQDIQELRHALEFYLSGLMRDAASRQNPHATAMADALRALRVADDVVAQLLGGPPANGDAATANVGEADPCSLLVRDLAFDTREPDGVAGRIALVGPPGAGKTTTVAKLAALAIARGGPEQVAIVAADGGQVGDSARLDAYARLLGVPVHRFATAQELADLMGALAGFPLVLVDGAGLEPGGRPFAPYLALLRDCAGLEVLLALPATLAEPTLETIARAYAPAHPAGCVLTKLDAAASLGDALSVVLRHHLRVVWGADGQGVPADIHRLQAPALIRRLGRALDAAWTRSRLPAAAAGATARPGPSTRLH